MKKQPFEETRNRINKISEALFGGPEEMDAGEAREILAAAGFDADDLDAKLYARLVKEAQHYWGGRQTAARIVEKGAG